MNLVAAYKNGWKVLYRTVVFYVCFAVAYMPVGILTYAPKFFGLEINEGILSVVTLIILFGYVPLCFHFAAWYSGEFNEQKPNKTIVRNGE